MGKLYGDNKKCIIKTGSHVIHIGEVTKDAVVLDGEITQEIKVTQKEAYSNESEMKTVDFFNSLMEESARDYENVSNPQFKVFLEKIRDYVTADSRHGQQEKLTSLKKFYKENKSANNDIRKYEKFMEKEMSFDGLLDTGDYVPEQKVTEPSFSGVSGALSVWVSRKNDSLFPHTPSSNDIKQGVGLEDCFMLAALGEMVNKDPKSITEAMKDNDNGTVTVRFWKGPEEKREPVFITVNKTESRVVGGMNSYASGSLWVQMMEKAYAKFVDQEYPKDKKGMAAISRSTTANFMNAFTKEGGYDTYPTNMGFGMIGGNMSSDGILGLDSNTYDINNKQAYVGSDSKEYNGYENLMYKFMDNQINKKGEVITVGNNLNNDFDKKRQSFTLDHGIRNGHAYSVLKVFEKDGKKFVQLKDPYSTFESKYNDKGDLENNSSIASSTMRAGNDTMGTFNMEIRDFFTCFNSIPGMKKESFNKMDNILRIYDKLVRPNDLDNKIPNFTKKEADKIIDAYLESDDKDFCANVHKAILACSNIRKTNPTCESFLKGYFNENTSKEEKENLLKAVSVYDLNQQFTKNKDDIVIENKDNIKINENTEVEKNTEVSKEKTENTEKSEMIDEFDDMAFEDFQEDKNIQESKKVKEESKKESDIDFSEYEIVNDDSYEPAKKDKDSEFSDFEIVEEDSLGTLTKEDKELNEYKAQMMALEDELKKTKGTFRDSNQYKNLIAEVEKARTVSMDGIENSKNNIIKMANEYLKVKMTETIKGKNPSDISAKKMTIAENAISSLGGKPIKIEDVRKELGLMKEKISYKDLEKIDNKKKIEDLTKPIDKSTEKSKDKSNDKDFSDWYMA